MPKLVKMNENTAASEQLLRPSVIKISRLLLEKIEASSGNIAVIETKLQMDLMDAFIKLSAFVLKFQENVTSEAAKQPVGDSAEVIGTLTEEDIKVLKIFVGSI